MDEDISDFDEPDKTSSEATEEIGQLSGRSRRSDNFKGKMKTSTIAVLATALLASNLYWMDTTADAESELDLRAAEKEIVDALKLDRMIMEYYGMIGDYYIITVPDDWSLQMQKEADAEFAADLARHSIGEHSWPWPEECYYENTGRHSYDDAKKRLEFFLNISGVESEDSLATRIEKILAHVNDFVDYWPDLRERFNSPWETLAYRSGDCDDYSILVASLFELAGVDSAFACVNNSEGTDHALVLVHLEDLGSYDYISFQNLTDFGLSEGQWIQIEPQHTIDLQFDFEGKTEWLLQAAEEVIPPPQ